GCTLVGIQGSYIVQAKSAIDRINELRKEACKEGIRDPRNESRNLTMDDYTPINWSSDLEYIARIRAAEANVITGHTRANGKSCWSIQSENGVSSYGEILAWNFSKTMTSGIEQWYEEKYDWVKQTGGVTGHYTQMIDPSNLYIGLGTFYSSDGAYPNCTAGEFSSRQGLDTTVGKSISNCIQTIEIEKSVLGTLSLKKFSGGSKFYAGKTAEYQPVYNVESIYGDSQVISLESAKWKSSNTSVATVNNGKVKCLKAGKVVVTCELSAGEKTSVTVTVSKSAQPMTVKVKTKNVKASILKKKSQTIKKAITVNKAKGKVTYKKVKKGSTASVYNKIKINNKGEITLKKGKYTKGNYKLKVKVTAAGNADFNSGSKTVTVKIKVK
ncbi:MAG: CAP domain-containing protein, partial [Ruminococcus sp.]|nr:CAP domain-containing protein [Ruminococcus sp.]